jgi:hypothetical protein
MGQAPFGVSVMVEQRKKRTNWMKKTFIQAIEQADKTKNNINIILAKEFRLFLDSIKVDELLKKIIDGQTIEINTVIKFSPQKTAAKAVKKEY